MPAAIAYVDALTADVNMISTGGGPPLASATTGFLWDNTSTVNLVLVAIAMESSTVASVVIGGLSATRHAAVAIGNVRLELWRLYSAGNLESETTDLNFVITMNGAASFQTAYACFVGGMNPAAPLADASTDTAAAGNAVDAAVTSKSGQLVVAVGAAEGENPASDAGQTDRGYYSGAGSTLFVGSLSTEAGAATVTMGVTTFGAANQAIIVAAIQQASGRRSTCPTAGLRVGRRGQPLKPLRQRRKAA